MRKHARSCAQFADWSNKNINKKTKSVIYENDTNTTDAEAVDAVFIAATFIWNLITDEWSGQCCVTNESVRVLCVLEIGEREQEKKTRNERKSKIVAYKNCQRRRICCKWILGMWHITHAIFTEWSDDTHVHPSRKGSAHKIFGKPFGIPNDRSDREKECMHARHHILSVSYHHNVNGC